jgi:SAM-dependent methyltransferase
MFPTIKAVTPTRLKRLFSDVLSRSPRLECPICGGSARAFLPFGRVPRPNAKCPTCGSLERHRQLWLFFRRQTDLFDGRRKSMLHFAPERMLATRLSKIDNLQYVSADLIDRSAAVRVDITNMPFTTGAFDVLLCSHVLEHIPDDRRAMRECLRVMKQEGLAIFMVPVTVPVTVEDPTITDPAERERLFGQHDHVRCYGMDIVQRLEQAGFEVATLSTRDIAGPDASRYAIPEHASPLFFCTRQRSQS